jgi:hypothetical protein
MSDFYKVSAENLGNLTKGNLSQSRGEQAFVVGKKIPPLPKAER